MIVSRIASTVGNAGPHRENTTPPRAVPAEPLSTRNAIVPLERAAPASATRPSRPDASFVTQLIATAEQAPQTRSLRRASPADAQAVYASAALRGPADRGKVLSQIV